MTTTPVRRLAAGATTALLALGLLTPAALAVADELPVEDQTTTVLDEAAPSPESTSETQPAPDPAPVEEPSPEAPDVADDPLAEPAPAEAAEPAPADPAAEDAAPAARAAEPLDGAAALTASLALEPGETWSTTVDVTDAVRYSFIALGSQLSGSLRIPSGQTFTLLPQADYASVYTGTGPAATGTATLSIRNDGASARSIPYAFGYERAGVTLGISSGIGGLDLDVVANPVVNGAGRAGLTGEVRLLGADGFTATSPLRPFTTGSTGYTTTFTGIPASRYLIEVSMTIDGVVHEMVMTSFTAAPDSTPPVVEYLTEPAASNAHGWFRRAVTVTLAASDAGAGVWRIFQGLDTTTLEPRYTNRTTVDVTTEGEHVLRYYAEDYQYNSSPQSERTIRIDLTNPTADVQGIPDEVELGTEVPVTYSCDDALSGVLSCTAPVASGELLDTSLEGTHTFTVVAVDRAGNEHRLERSYTVVSSDSTAPQLDVEVPEEPASGWHTGPVALGFAAEDEESGIALIHWEYGTASGVVIGESTTSTGELELDATGEYEVEVWAEDGAGNRSETQTFTVRIDVSAPVVRFVSPADPIASILPNGHYAQNERVVIDIDCTDEGSGLDRCDASTPDGEYLPTGTPGTHELRVVATDVAGNRTERVLSYTVDATAASGGSGSPTASRDPRLAQTGADYVLPGIVLVAVLLAAGATLLTTRRLGGR